MADPPSRPCSCRTSSSAEFGSRAEALRTYRRCKDTLIGELGVSPDRATAQLYERLLAAQ
ncbi:MAG: bacterial transcriptional activator domain-containing protein [Ilumatobacteraceae bacterium]